MGTKLVKLVAKGYCRCLWFKEGRDEFMDKQASAGYWETAAGWGTPWAEAPVVLGRITLLGNIVLGYVLVLFLGLFMIAVRSRISSRCLERVVQLLWSLLPEHCAACVRLVTKINPRMAENTLHWKYRVAAGGRRSAAPSHCLPVLVALQNNAELSTRGQRNAPRKIRAGPEFALLWRAGRNRTVCFLSHLRLRVQKAWVAASGGGWEVQYWCLVLLVTGIPCSWFPGISRVCAWLLWEQR